MNNPVAYPKTNLKKQEAMVKAWKAKNKGKWKQSKELMAKRDNQDINFGNSWKKTWGGMTVNQHFSIT